MVYCGKPSSGCDTCRARKVKCDQTRPACIRCTQSNKVCSGYRDVSSLRFRDESQSVIKKIEIMASSRTKSSPSADIAQRRSKSMETVDTSIFQGSQMTPFILPKPLKADPKFEATCFFIESYSSICSGAIQRCEPVVSLTTPLAQKALKTAITSVGLANISSIQYSKTLRMEACREYAEALKWTNAAISDSTQATEDATLAAILCLSMFEVITCRKRESTTDFIQHTKGAIALLGLRGDVQLQRQAGIELFYAMRSQIMTGCILKRYPFPRELMTLSEKVTKLPGVPLGLILGHKLTCIMADVCDLRICSGESPKSIDADLLSRCFALDSQIEALENSFPPEWMYKTVSSAPGQFFKVTATQQIVALNGTYHIYPNWQLPNLWNNYRYARILVLEIILNQLKLMLTKHDAPPPTQDLINICCRSCNLARKLAHDVCASVPYVLGLIDDHKMRTKAAAGNMTILYPLYVAATVDGPGSKMCDWVQDCFTKLGRGMGIEQALILADLLSRDESMAALINDLHQFKGGPNAESNILVDRVGSAYPLAIQFCE